MNEVYGTFYGAKEDDEKPDIKKTIDKRTFSFKSLGQSVYDDAIEDESMFKECLNYLSNDHLVDVNQQVIIALV